MLKIGLTGGIGSGKTTVANYFKALGVPVIDADEVARDVVKPGLPAFDKIVETFGSDVLNETQVLDRAKLRQLIFSDPAAKLKLESILHPIIRQNIKHQIESLDAPYCIIVIPLLIETNQLSLVDRVLVVDIDPELQIIRTQNRDGDKRSQIEAIIASQVDIESRLSVADDVLKNDGDEQQLQASVDKMNSHYLSLLKTSI